MTVLHTSDWHLGKMLHGRKRHEEFASFLDWLVDLIKQQSVNILVVSGDVFDTCTPSNKSQQLYYEFLGRISKSCCRHLVITAGNHDSPSFLNAPRDILRDMNVHVVGSITENPGDDVIVLADADENPEAVVCAVPYLRDKDIRSVDPGETVEDKTQKLIDGLVKHYSDVCTIAERKCKELGNIPVIATGHLFSAGGKTVEGNGVRDLYIGSLAHVAANVFPDRIDYLALAHRLRWQRFYSPVVGYLRVTRYALFIMVFFEIVRICNSPMTAKTGRQHVRRYVKDLPILRLPPIGIRFAKKSIVRQ